MKRFQSLVLAIPLLLAACVQPEPATAVDTMAATSPIDIFPLSDRRFGFTARTGRMVCEDDAKSESSFPNTCSCPAVGMSYFISSKDDMTFVSCRQSTKPAASHALSTKPSH